MPTEVIETPPATPPATPPVTTTPEAVPPAVATTPPVETPPAAPATPPAEPAQPEAVPTPTLPEKYVLTLPEHAPFDESILEPLSAEAKALGLTQAQFDTLVKHRATATTDLAQKFLTDLRADKELGGAQFDATQKHAIAGFEYVFPRGTPGNDLIRSFLETTGFGNHPEVVREFVRIGKARAEDRPFLGTRTDAVERKPIEDVMYPTMAAK